MKVAACWLHGELQPDNEAYALRDGNDILIVCIYLAKAGGRGPGPGHLISQE